MTKPSIKKLWGQVFAGALVASVGYSLIMNINDAEVIKICLQTLLWACGVMFGLKVGTGAVEALKKPSGGDSGT